jgi:hypothetical protein
MIPRTGLLLSFLILGGAAARLEQVSPWTLSMADLPSPASGDSGEPQLTVSSKGVLLSWIERAGQTATLRFSERTASGWSEPRSVASGSDWFVNWADVPSVLRLAGGDLAAHWLQKSAAATYAYDVRLAYSTDAGRTWSPSFKPYSDGTSTDHGFASLLQLPGAGLGLVWLDGRATAGGHAGHGQGGAMSVRFGAFNRQWKQTAETAVDLRVCDCCPTAAAVTSEGLVAVFRDRSDDEVRDISVTRLERNTWTMPTPVHRDNWRIQACPLNGPAISASGRSVAVAWFTAEGDRPRAYVAFSKDAGRTFGSPVRIDDGVSLGRVDVELLPDGSAIAAYIEQADKRAQFRVRRVERVGTTTAPITIAGIDAGRASGYPRIAVHQGELVAAWVERDGARRVRTAAARIPELLGR